MKRRSLLSALGLAPLAARAAALPSAGTGPCDVAVVGSGLAGLSAAIAAREAGASRVVVFERERFVGGHSALANGYFAAEARDGRTEAQYREAVSLMVDDMNETGKRRGNPELVRVLAQESGAAVEWLTKMGVVWMRERVEALGGLRPRCYCASFARGGYDYVVTANRRARELGVEILFSSPVLAVARRPDGAMEVTFERDGTHRSVTAGAVILASGGFGDNPAMRKLYDPRLSEHFTSTANPYGEAHDTALGDGIRIGLALGAATVDMEQILSIPYSGGRLTNYVGADVYVTCQGRRFVNEAAPMSEISRALWALPEKEFWVITDSQSAKGITRDAKLVKGIVRTADTIEEAARLMKIAPAVLKETMREYNEAARTGRDPLFGRTTFTQLIDKPPFYFGKERPFVHFCSGGLRINADAQVCSGSGDPVPGLFAAGEVTGGVHGHGRLGGASLTDCVVFGRRAGRSAALRAKSLASG